MNTEYVRRNVTMPADVAALLDRTGNVSDYVATSVRLRWQRWQHALLVVRACFGDREILAACETLNGDIALDATHRNVHLLLERLRASTVLDKHSITPKRWTACLDALRSKPENIDALADLVSEFWSGNHAIKNELNLTK